MRLNSKVTWGLAWAGLAVVVAVPSMDFLTGKLGDGNKAALITSTTDPVTPGGAPVKTSSVTTTLTKNGVIITPAGSTAPTPSGAAVDKYLTTNKTLPSYISDGTAAPAVVTTPSTTTQVANIDPVAPMPFPARPADLDKTAVEAPAAVTAPIITDPVITGSTQAPATITTAPQQVVIVDQPQTAAIDPAAPRPPADIVDDSANWKSKGLEQYLDKNGLLDNGKSTAAVTQTEQPASNYDSNGFYLSDGPNGSRVSRRARVEQLFDQAPDAPPQSFNLF